MTTHITPGRLTITDPDGDRLDITRGVSGGALFSILTDAKQPRVTITSVVISKEDLAALHHHLGTLLNPKDRL